MFKSKKAKQAVMDALLVKEHKQNFAIAEIQTIAMRLKEQGIGEGYLSSKQVAEQGCKLSKALSDLQLLIK